MTQQYIWRNYIPQTISNFTESNQIDILLGHYFLKESFEIKVLLNLKIRVQEIDFIRRDTEKCLIKESELNKFISLDLDVIKRGLLLNKDQFYECILNNEFPK